jgi:hypothetical protein
MTEQEQEERDRKFQDLLHQLKTEYMHRPLMRLWDPVEVITEEGATIRFGPEPATNVGEKSDTSAGIAEAGSQIAQTIIFSALLITAAAIILAIAITGIDWFYPTLFLGVVSYWIWQRWL